MGEFTRRHFLKTAGLSTAGFFGSGFLSGCGVLRNRLPNFVIIFTDDQGYADVGCYGAEGFKTPNLDRMASEGMRFTSFYVSQAVCSASRASLLTGCYAERVSIRGALSPWADVGLNPEEETIAEVLKKRGYATGIFGKWHLGHHREFLPLQHGFDEYLGLPYSNDMWPVGYDGSPMTEGHKANYPPLPIIDGNEKAGEIRTLEDQAVLTTRYTERAVKFIEKNKNNPFFLYVPHSMVHVPLGVSDKFKGKSQQGLYGDVMMELDWSVGEILRSLERHGLDEDTLVIFTSDNGPWLNFGNHAGSALPLREGKGTMFEGGVRVPCIMRWPGKISPGTVCHRMAATIDILPTLAAITGTVLHEKPIDGVNILPLLEGKADVTPRDHYFFYYGGGLRAVRQGRWKLYFPHKSRSYDGVVPGHDGYPGPYATLVVGLELYDLENDIGETHNVAEQHPEIVTRLRVLADKAREELGDTLTQRKGKHVRPPGRRGADRPYVSHLAVGKSITLKNTPSIKYPGDREDSLIDGFRGSFDHTDGKWQGFEGEDLEALIDLGSFERIKKITCSFLQHQVSWIFLPETVEVGVSRDGDHFETIGRFREKTEADARTIVKEYPAEFEVSSVRYVRVRAKNIGVCPGWHAGAGGKAWLFVDEIIVE